MSALDSPPPTPPALTTAWKQTGAGGEGGRTHMPSMRCLAGVRSDVSLPLYSACCLHAAAAAAAVRVGGGAVPAASYRILGVAAAKKGEGNT